MKIVLIGVRCSGKGTYASKLSPMLGIPHISTGEIFRKNIEKGTSLGEKVKEIYNSGGLVSDEITLELIKERLKEPDCGKGFIFDGFPRTLEQAKELDKLEKIDFAFYLDVSEDVVLERLSTRVLCKKCGNVYNTKIMKPKEDGVCDKCGGELYQKEDDKPEAARKRLEMDKENLKQLLDYYKDKGILKTINCDKVDIDTNLIVNEIMEILMEE